MLARQARRVSSSLVRLSSHWVSGGASAAVSPAGGVPAINTDLRGASTAWRAGSVSVVRRVSVGSRAAVLTWYEFRSPGSGAVPAPELCSSSGPPVCCSLGRSRRGPLRVSLRTEGVAPPLTPGHTASHWPRRPSQLLPSPGRHRGTTALASRTCVISSLALFAPPAVHLLAQRTTPD